MALKLLNGYCGVTVVILRRVSISSQKGRGERERMVVLMRENLITLRNVCYAIICGNVCLHCVQEKSYKRRERYSC